MQHAHCTVNDAKGIGKDHMEGQSVIEYTLKRKNQAIILGMKSSLKIGGNTLQINPHTGCQSNTRFQG